VKRLEESFADRSFVERILEIARSSERPPLPGPDREQLLGLLEATHRHDLSAGRVI
jgi:hypothetical protein